MLNKRGRGKGNHGRGTSKRGTNEGGTAEGGGPVKVGGGGACKGLKGNQ